MQAGKITFYRRNKRGFSRRPSTVDMAVRGPTHIQEPARRQNPPPPPPHVRASTTLTDISNSVDRAFPCTILHYPAIVARSGSSLVSSTMARGHHLPISRVTASIRSNACVRLDSGKSVPICSTRARALRGYVVVHLITLLLCSTIRFTGTVILAVCT